jgi:hypothetical protein
MNVRDLAIKFTSYVHYIASREWAREHSMLPVLICIAPDIAQERRVQRVAEASLAHTPGLVLWTTTEGLFQEQGPLALIWLRDMSQPKQTSPPGGAQRQCLSDVMLAKHCL